MISSGNVVNILAPILFQETYTYICTTYHIWTLRHSQLKLFFVENMDTLILYYNDVIMRTMASQITSLASVYSTVYSGADQRKHQSSAPLSFVWGIHRGPVNSPHKWPVTRKTFPFDDAIMYMTNAMSAGDLEVQETSTSTVMVF